MKRLTGIFSCPLGARARALCLIAFVLHAWIGLAASSEPKLVVLISVDGCRQDLLSRFESDFGPGGFQLLLKHGANFTDCHVDHIRPSTGPGHTVMMTGAYGYASGIVDNEWWDRRLNKEVNCVEDPDSPIVDGLEPRSDKFTGRSPRNLLVSTVGDELKITTQSRSKVIGISFKDRAAMLTTGKLADAAYWFDPDAGKIVSSRYYLDQLPDWLDKFNKVHNVDAFFGKQWDRLLPENAYSASREDDFPHELNYRGLGRTFPHPIDGGKDKIEKAFYEAFSYLPFADAHLERLARVIVDEERLGQDEYPDILTIGFSSTDRVGHVFGPFSQEMQDQMIRLDRILAGFFEFLEDRIGLDNVLVALTADHGSTVTPEYLLHLREIPAGRIDPAKRPDDVDSVVIPEAIESALDQRFGEDDWIKAFVKPNLYFNHDAIRSRGLESAVVERFAADSLAGVRGVGEVFTRHQILSGQIRDTRVARRISNQFHFLRSGDLIPHYQTHFVTGGYDNTVDEGSDHETGYTYDTHIPLLLMGAAVKPGTYRNTIRMNDIAPTITAILRISLPSASEGRILSEALKD